MDVIGFNRAHKSDVFQIMSTFLFYIGHPAHFHNFKIVSKRLKESGHHIVWVLREKDVLFDLAQNSPFTKHFIPEKKPKTKLQRIGRILSREWKMFWIFLKYRPKLSIGTDLVITHLGKVFNTPSIVVNEDDAEAVPLFAKYGMRYASTILAPTSCSVGNYANKSIQYPGYQELAYLAPLYFKAEKEKVQSLFGENEKYFLLRFASLTAHHDEGVEGIDNVFAEELITNLLPHGNVWISAERPLPSKLEKYRLKLDPSKMHHALAFASIYIGDSQTMAAEAAVLGTLSIRYNDFVGKLGYLEELENKYSLTKGFKTGNKDALLSYLKAALTGFDQQEIEKNRQSMLKDAVDVNKLWTFVIEDYPTSVEQLKSDEKLMANFKF